MINFKYFLNLRHLSKYFLPLLSICFLLLSIDKIVFYEVNKMDEYSNNMALIYYLLHSLLFYMQNNLKIYFY